jgi:hypothetical protein
MVLDFTRFEDRWAWTISEALPKWMAVEKTDARHKLSLLVLCKDGSLPIMAINWLKRGRMTSVFSQVDLLIEAMSSASQFQRLATMIGNIVTEVLLRWVLLPPGNQRNPMPNGTPQPEPPPPPSPEPPPDMGVPSPDPPSMIIPGMAAPDVGVPNMDTSSMSIPGMDAPSMGIPGTEVEERGGA